MTTMLSMTMNLPACMQKELVEEDIVPQTTVPLWHQETQVTAVLFTMIVLDTCWTGPCKGASSSVLKLKHEI